MPDGKIHEGRTMDMNVDSRIGSVLERIAPISRQIWDAKYRLKSEDGTPIDLTIEDSWWRLARALAAVETDPERWEQPFYDALRDFRFLPAGRILSGAGADRRVTLFNCFVMGDIGDDLGSIFEHLREAALTMQQGGGIGYDFSTLRPKGAPVRGVGADASGPLSFMDVWDAMCRTIMSAGALRRLPAGLDQPGQAGAIPVHPACSSRPGRTGQPGRRRRPHDGQHHRRLRLPP